MTDIEPAAWPFRLPVIRHIRAIALTHRINRHYAAWRSIGFLPVHADRDWEIVERIRKGEL